MNDPLLFQVKHILYEQENRLVKVKALAEMAQKVAEDDHQKNLDSLNVGKNALRVQLKELELAEKDRSKVNTMFRYG